MLFGIRFLGIVKVGLEGLGEVEAVGAAGAKGLFDAENGLGAAAGGGVLEVGAGAAGVKGEGAGDVAGAGAAGLAGVNGEGA